MAHGQIVQKKPFVIREAGGKVRWCACGRSANQPYCDGSHEGSGFRPIEVDIEPGRTVAWCACKHSGRKPFCDGTHTRL